MSRTFTNTLFQYIRKYVVEKSFVLAFMTYYNISKPKYQSRNVREVESNCVETHFLAKNINFIEKIECWLKIVAALKKFVYLTTKENNVSTFQLELCAVKGGKFLLTPPLPNKNVFIFKVFLAECWIKHYTKLSRTVVFIQFAVY